MVFKPKDCDLLLVGHSPNWVMALFRHLKQQAGVESTIPLCQQARGFSKEGTSLSSSHSCHFAVITYKGFSAEAIGFFNSAKLKMTGHSVNSDYRL